MSSDFFFCSNEISGGILIIFSEEQNQLEVYQSFHLTVSQSHISMRFLRMNAALHTSGDRIKNQRPQKKNSKIK